MECPFCKTDVPIHTRERHLIVSRDCRDNAIHVHGDITDKEIMKQFVEATNEQTGINLEKQILDRKEIVFKNRQRIGDMLMFTCGVRDFKKAFPDVRVNVVSIAPHIWDYNPYIDRTLTPTEENTLAIGPGKLTNSSNRIDWHFANAFRISIEDALHVSIPQGESRPDIWLSTEEFNAPRLWPQPYWIISLNGEKGWGSKMYPFDRFQEFVNQNPDMTFVQIGTREDNPPRLQGPNIIDHVGKTQDNKTGIRDLFKLFLNAEGSIGLVSFHMHLSAAYNKPCIVIAGAREPVSFTQYPGHRYLSTDGSLPCAVSACWRCDIDACTNLVVGKEKVPRCVDMIDPSDITRALRQYYLGGRLDMKSPAPKPKFKNIIKAAATAAPVPSGDITRYGMAWGGGCITEKDWEFMKQVIEKHKVKTVLEFGTGLSTLLMNDMGLRVMTYETNQGWIDKIKSLNPAIDIRIWDGKNLSDLSERYDMAFVDGPAGGLNREFSTKIGAESADVVIVHDAGRENERKWQEKYLMGAFVGPGKGGNRCHLWTRIPALASEMPDLPPCEPQGDTICAEIAVGTGKKTVKLVSTARGWGGCARSVTTIMKFLVKEGHKVEFIPFRNQVSSKEYQEFLKNHPEITVTLNYATLGAPCDVLFVYADDYVWEFGHPDIVDAFSLITADKKIMMLNYRRGDVGKIPWTQGWDKYMFLNSGQEKELKKLLPNIKTKVLPPCTELEEFLQVQPNYNSNIRIVRHNSQGDTKFDKGFEKEVDRILMTRVDVQIHMLPGPSYMIENDKIRKYPRVSEAADIARFLSRGNVFWYSLPIGYMDMGPRVVLEAMASGLPVIADNWGGAPDRVTPECGWICDTKEQQAEVIKNLTFDEMKKKGTAARERAVSEFVPQKWIGEILNV